MVHLDAYHRISLLSLVFEGKSFSTIEAGVTGAVFRLIEEENAKRLDGNGFQGMQEGAMGDEMLMTGRAERNPSKWHAELINAWETNQPSVMEEAISKNIDDLE